MIRPFSFAVVMPVGPGPDELHRVRDTLESLETFEAGKYFCVLIDDGRRPAELAWVAGPQLTGRLAVIQNPRRGQGNGWAAGCTAAVLAGLKELERRRVEYEFVLKLDTDALVIRSFANQIRELLLREPMVGMIGSLRSSSQEGFESLRPLALACDKLLKQVTIWRMTPLGRPAIQIGFWGRYRKIRDVLRNAIIHGFHMGEHCLGGGYALSRKCVLEMERFGLFHDPTVWLTTPLVEDLTVSLCVKAVQLHLRDFGQPGEVFSVKFQGLAAKPKELSTLGFAIIHSVKDRSGFKEADIRAFFRELRPASLPHRLDVSAEPFRF